MSWLKKHSGAVTGALTLGGAGALLSAATGNAIDKNRAAKARAGATDYNSWYKENRSDIGLLRNSPSSLSTDRMSQMLSGITSTSDWKTNAGVMADVENLRANLQAAEAQRMQEEYEAAMLESYQLMAEYQGMAAEAQKQAAEAAAYQAPYQQPIAKAGDAYGEAAADTQNRQLMRRGLLSLTRFGDYGNQRLGVA